MITLLHGEDISKSRTELLVMKDNRYPKECRVVDGKNVSDTDLIQALSSESLFDEDTFVIIEQLFSSQTKKIKRVDTLIHILKEAQDSQDIIVWEDKKLTPSVLNKLGKKIIIKEFSYPSILFSFIDNFHFQKIPELIQQYKKLIEQEPAEVVQVLLMRRIRQLILLKAGKSVPDLQSWQLSRLTNQNRFFTMDELLTIYQSFVALDLSIKTGTTYLSLQEETERLMAEIYYDHK